MRIKLVAITAILLALAAGAAQARPQFVSVLTQAYPASAGPLQQRSCQNCHVSMSDLTRNAYGKQLEAAMQAAGASDLTPAILHKVETLDAAGDGVTNLTRITQGLPPAGAPGGAPKAGGTSAVASAPANPPNPEQRQWMPRNGFHPAVVHFPIALFIAGLFLDFLGLIRKDKTLLAAGWYNLVLAAVSALGAGITGLAAIVLQKITIEGVIRTHLSLAILATVILWALVGLRVHKHENIQPGARVLYYILAAINLCVISYTGHLGGMYVYGS